MKLGFRLNCGRRDMQVFCNRLTTKQTERAICHRPISTARNSDRSFSQISAPIQLRYFQHGSDFRSLHHVLCDCQAQNPAAHCRVYPLLIDFRLISLLNNFPVLYPSSNRISYLTDWLAVLTPYFLDLCCRYTSEKYLERLFPYNSDCVASIFMSVVQIGK